MNPKILLLIISTTILTACGGSSSNNTPKQVSSPTPNPQAATYTGVFIDSAVQGLNYETATQSGKTSAAGEFVYQLGESVVFSIGNIVFPSVSAKAEITPLDIFNTADDTHVGVVNMLRLLQTLDVDGMADNGIEIADLAHTLAANLNIDFTNINFEQSLADYITNNNNIYLSLISEEQALQHFRETLMVEPPMMGCGDDHPKVGYTGSFSTLAHDVTGTVTIIDNCTLQVENFNYDATAPAVYFYGDVNENYSSNNAFTIGAALRRNQVPYINDSFILRLPNNRTLDDLNYLSVWCIDIPVSFGDLMFTAP